MNSHEDFRKLIRQERENLLRLSDFWSNQIKSNQITSQEDQGRARAAVGKTHLLLDEKFKQFEGLVEQSENNTAEKEITMNDLQGFWDLVQIQVNDIKAMYKNLKASNTLKNGNAERSEDARQIEQQ